MDSPQIKGIVYRGRKVMLNPVLDRFENTVSQFPGKTAVACREECYTFTRLQDVSRRLGARIAEEGLKGEPVGVLVNRGCDTAAFFLAVLYSGNFYVPIDGDLPAGKMQRILQDAEPQVILCGEEDKRKLEELDYEGRMLTLEDLAAVQAAVPAATDETPICLLYTSGSTGQPKGVLKSYGAVAAFMETFIRQFHLGPEEIIGNQTPFFFDASAKDFYLMIYTGATLEILPSELFVFPKTLIEYMNERRVSYICWVPSALSVVTQLNTFQEVLPETLQKIFFVGETFPVRQLQKWMKALPDASYVNLYGSTELAGICCFYELPNPFEEEEIPIGKPLADCQVFLCDTEQEPYTYVTEPDKIGEILVVSESLALGYYHDPRQTEKTFVQTTLPDGTPARALRTGDLAKYDPSGNLVFVSRRDNQIKYSGHRIELGEIESVVEQFKEVVECCCLYNEKKQQICLFCILAEGCTWDRREMKRLLRDKLSDYMLPAKYFFLESMPKNANGKTDRVKLRELYF